MTSKLAPRLLAAVSLIAGTTALSGHLTGGWSYVTSSTSPDHRYRVDLYTANRWQRLVHGFWDDEPGVARLIRLDDHRQLGMSSVISLTDGEVTWLPDEVVVGTQTVRKLPQGSWR